MKIANLFEKYIKNIESYKRQLRREFLYPYFNIRHLFSKNGYIFL